jgi:hypothetical protein
LQSIESITYYGEDGTEHAFTDFITGVSSIPGRVYLKPGCEWPTIPLLPDAGIKITFTAGYVPVEASGDTPGDPAGNVPQFIKDCICALINYWYEDRSRSDIPDQIKTALAPSRMWPI